jgi:hypothetical protein
MGKRYIKVFVSKLIKLQRVKQGFTASNQSKKIIGLCDRFSDGG